MVRVWNSDRQLILTCDTYNSHVARKTIANEIAKETNKLLKSKPYGSVRFQTDNGPVQIVSVSLDTKTE